MPTVRGENRHSILFTLSNYQKQTTFCISKVLHLFSLIYSCSSRICELNECTVQQVQLDCHYYVASHDKCELQYRQLWSGEAAYRTRGRLLLVDSSAHSREESHSPDHPRAGHLHKVHQRYLIQGCHSHRRSHFPQRRERLQGNGQHMDNPSCLYCVLQIQLQKSRCAAVLQEVHV